MSQRPGEVPAPGPFKENPSMLIDLAAVVACVLYLVALVLRHEAKERGYIR